MQSGSKMLNIVLEDICRFSSLESVFNHIEEIKDNFGEVFIIGGATV